jgi:hypothetical protein
MENINKNVSQFDNQKLNEIQQNINKTKNYYMFTFVYIVVLTILIIYNIYKINKLNNEIKNEFKKQIDDNFSNSINLMNSKYEELKLLNEKSLTEFANTTKSHIGKVTDRLTENEKNIRIMMNKYTDQYFEDVVKKITTEIYRNIDIIDIIKGSYNSIKNNLYLVVDIYKADEYFSKFNNNDTLIHNNQTSTIQELKSMLNFEPKTNQILIKILTADITQRQKNINERYILLQKNMSNDILQGKSLYTANDKYNHDIYANIGNQMTMQVI